MDELNIPNSSEIDLLIKKYSPMFAEIRKRLIYTTIFFGIFSMSGFVFNQQIIKFLIDILSLKGVNIVFTSPFQFINLAISSGIASGVVFVFPLLIYQILSFIRFLPFSVILFIAGFGFGFWIMKWQIEIFLAQSVSIGIGNILDISNLLSTVLLTSIFMGLGFQFPVILLFLLRLGIVKPSQLSKYRLWVYLGALIFAILLPADSLLADALLMLPFIIMFELVLIFNRLFK